MSPISVRHFRFVRLARGIDAQLQVRSGSVSELCHIPADTLVKHCHLRGHADADYCCGKSMIESALVGLDVRQPARPESISKRAPSTTPTRTSLRLWPSATGLGRLSCLNRDRVKKGIPSIRAVSRLGGRRCNRCNAARQPWQIWRPWQSNPCIFLNLKDYRETESLSLRQFFFAVSW